MKTRTRRNNRAANKDQDDHEDDASSYAGSPGKEKENLSPPPNSKRLSQNEYQRRFETLLKDFDHTVAMTKKEMCTNSQIAADKLSMPFLQALMKIPNQIKNMEWDEYLKLRANTSQGSSFDAPSSTKTKGVTIQDPHQFAAPANKYETPALRSSSRLAKNKLPAITPKFDPSTPASFINKRLPEPGEMLVSLKGSPVAVPNMSSVRAIANSAANGVPNEEMISTWLKNPDARKAFIKAYKASKD